MMQQDIFNTQVSWYNGKRDPNDPTERMDTVGHVCTLRQFLSAGLHWKPVIDHVRH